MLLVVRSATRMATGRAVSATFGGLTFGLTMRYLGMSLGMVYMPCIFSRREAGSRTRSTTKRDGQPRSFGWPTSEVTRSARTGERTPGRAGIIEPERDVPGHGRPLPMKRSAHRSGAHGVEAGLLWKIK